MAKRCRVTLTPAERDELRQLISRGKAAARELAHARILLQADESDSGPGRTGEQIAPAPDTCTRTVERVREHFVEQGIEAAPLPRPGKRAYVRNGVASLSMTFEPLAGWRHVDPTGPRTAVDWARVVKGLVGAPRYRDAEVIVPVMDQLDTHGKWGLCEAFAPDEARRIAERLEVHYTPKHGSWLNMAEIELGAFARDPPERIGDARAMASHVAAWEKRRDGIKVKADWQFTTADARIKLRKLYPTVEG